MDLFSNLSLQINVQKSTLSPVQHLEFIAAHRDAIQARAFLSAHRFSTIVNLVSIVRNSLQISAKTAAQPYGSSHVWGKTHQVAHALSPGVATHSVRTSQMQSSQTPNHAYQDQGNSTLGTTPECLNRGPFSPTWTIPDSNNPCFPNRLGSTPSDTHSAGKMVPGRILHAR